MSAPLAMDTLQKRDSLLEQMWRDFEDVPMNPETECIEASYLGYPAGTHREEIWKWFDERHSLGVAYLMYEFSTEEKSWRKTREFFTRAMCDECETASCVYNKDGVCRFALVHDRSPQITEQDGCVEGVTPSVIARGYGI